MAGGDWATAENDAVVRAYFAMLADDLANRPFSKAEINRTLQLGIGRSRGSIEFKFQNISAVCVGLGLPWVHGYKPRANFQISLAETVVAWLDKHHAWDVGSASAETQQFDAPVSLFIGAPPVRLGGAKAEGDDRQIERIARLFDVARKDEENRALGRAGEAVVFEHEKSFLEMSGRADLARHVRWVSRDEGDGLGYDVLSYTLAGEPRYIEVKTTRGAERTPFYISANELAVSQRHGQSWVLVRLWDFARTPKAFEIVPPLENHVELVATNFRASFAS